MQEKPVQIIDCSANPYDMRPAVEGILEQIERVRASLRADQPLIVIVNETHIEPTNLLLPPFLLEAVKTRQSAQSTPLKVACGLEWPHNYLGVSLEDNFSFDLGMFGLGNPRSWGLPPALKAMLGELDKDGQQTLTAFLSDHDPLMAPVSRLSAMKYYRESGISTRFIDTARKGQWPEFFLDQSDPSTLALIQQHAQHLVGQNIDAGYVDETRINPEAIMLRNIFMLHAAQKHLQDSEANIYLLVDGFAHDFAIDPQSQSYLMANLLNAAGIATLSIFIENSKFSEDPELKDAFKIIERTREHAIIVKGLAEIELDDEGIAQNERGIVENLLAQSESAIRIFHAQNESGRASEERRALRQTIEENAETWIREAYAACTNEGP